jgi:hypothetical protein
MPTRAPKEAKPSGPFIVYNAAGASDFHDDIARSIVATGRLPDDLSDVLTVKRVAVDGTIRWIVEFA